MRKIIALIFILILGSCQRNSSPTENFEPNNDAEILFYTEIINEYVLSNQIFQDVVNNSRNSLLNAEATLSGNTINTNNNPSITIVPFDLETFPKTLTIDFGSGTLCQDGITRGGIITMVSTGWYRQLGSIHTATFNNYFHDIFKVEGTQVVENFGENEDGQLLYSVSVIEGKVTSTSGLNVTYEEETSRTYIAGSETPLNIWDDEYLLQGLQFGFSSTGLGYSAVDEQQLHYDLIPRAIESGIVDLEIGGASDLKINYTNQTITVLGETTSWN